MADIFDERLKQYYYELEQNEKEMKGLTNTVIKSENSIEL